MAVFFTMLLAVSLSDTGELKTGALLQTLPEDGTWAKFRIKVNGDDQDFSLTWTVRSVGTVKHNGKLCRYVELERQWVG